MKNNIKRKSYARVAGFFYLILTILNFVGSLRFIIIPKNAATLTNIFIARIGFISDLLCTMFFLLLAWSLYMLFSDVNKNLSLLVILSISVSVAIQSINILNYFAVFQILSGVENMAVFEVDKLQALVMLYLELHTNGINIVHIFWALWLFPLGYLIFKSGYLSKSMGLLLMMGSFGYMLIFIITFLFPNYGVISIPGAVVGGVAELSLMVWLLLNGPKIPLKDVDRASGDEDFTF